MSPSNQSQAVVVVERFRNVLSECVPRTARRNSPATTIIGITPEQIAHGSLMRDFLNAVQGPNVVQSVDRRAQPTVQTEDLVFNESCEGKVVEKVGEVFPHVGVAIFAQALVIEAIHLGDLAGFVVSTKNRNTLGVADLEADQEGHSLDGVVASIDVITCMGGKQ